MSGKSWKFVEGLSKGDKIEFELPFFMLYLRSITSGTISRVLMLQVASEKLIFNSIVPYLNRIIVLMTQWRYLQAKAAEIISTEAPTKGFSDFLFKFNQSIASGEPVNLFIDQFYHIYVTIRERKYSAVSYHVGLVIPLYVISAALFAVIDGFFTSLIGFIGEMASLLDFFSVPEVSFMRLFFVFALVLFALNNVFSIYNMEGDSRFTVLYYTGMQMALGGTVYMIISEAVANYLAGVATI